MGSRPPRRQSRSNGGAQIRMRKGYDRKNWFHKIRLRIRALFQKEKLDAQMDDEMRSHVEMQTQENIDAGDETGGGAVCSTPPIRLGGIRVALGAQRFDVLNLVVGHRRTHGRPVSCQRRQGPHEVSSG